MKRFHHRQITGKWLLRTSKADNVCDGSVQHSYREDCLFRQKFFFSGIIWQNSFSNDAAFIFYEEVGVIWNCTFSTSKILQNRTVERLQSTFIIDVSDQRLRSIVLYYVCDGLREYCKYHVTSLIKKISVVFLNICCCGLWGAQKNFCLVIDRDCILHCVTSKMVWSLLMT